jgi:hypothetical protein
MQILSNPWSELPGFNCFDCCDKNPFGGKVFINKKQNEVPRGKPRGIIWNS